MHAVLQSSIATGPCLHLEIYTCAHFRLHDRVGNLSSLARISIGPGPSMRIHLGIMMPRAILIDVRVDRAGFGGWPAFPSLAQA